MCLNLVTVKVIILIDRFITKLESGFFTCYLLLSDGLEINSIISFISNLSL